MQTSNGRWRLSSSVTRRICNVTHQGAARGGPVVLRPVRATPCFDICIMLSSFEANKLVSGSAKKFRTGAVKIPIDLFQRTGATPSSVRRSFNSTMMPLYSCPIHGSCTSAKSGNGVRRFDVTSGCSVYATPRYNGPRHGSTRRKATSVEFRRRERCCGRHVDAESTPFTGSSCCLAAARRHADSVDAVLPFVTALDVVAGQESAAIGLRGPTDHTDTDGVFYTTNSQRPEACGRVNDLLTSVSWGPEHDVDITVYDSPTPGDRTPSVHVDLGSGKQLTPADATSAANDREQPTLLVDFH